MNLRKTIECLLIVSLLAAACIYFSLGTGPWGDRIRVISKSGDVGYESCVCEYENDQHRFNVYLPTDYDASTAYPLILMLHGYGNTAESFALQTGFEKYACPEGYVVVYLSSTPDGAGNVGWNSGLGDSDKDDVCYIKALAAYLQNEYNCDRERTFALGFSNGAFMTQRLAAEAPDVFTAVVSVAGMMTEKTWNSKPEKADIGVLEIYGTKDDVVPMKETGSDKYSKAPAIEEVMDYWAKANNLSESSKSELSDKATCEKYSNSDNSQQVWTIVIKDGRHSWPEEKFSGFSANRVILDFLGKY